MAKCSNPLDLLLLLLSPLEQVERLAGWLRWTRWWRRLVVQQTVGGGIVVVVVDVDVVAGGVAVEEIVGWAGDSFCPSQVGQEAPGEGDTELQTGVCQNHILSPLPQLPKGETHVFADHTPTSQWKPLHVLVFG